MDTSEQERKFRRLRLIVWGVGVLVVILAFFGIAFIALQAAPSEPVVVYDSKLTLTSACPTESVPVANDIEVKSDTVRAIKYTSTWEELGNPLSRKPAGAYIQHHVNQAKRHTELSRFLRVAPLQSGMWVLHTDAVVYYSVAGIPRQDTLAYDSRGTLAVDKLANKKCQNL